MEVSQVRKRLQQAIGVARERSQGRRQRTADAQRAYEAFLQDVAVPIARQVANALKVDGYAFSLFTPGEGLRLAEDRSRDDFIELALDTTGDVPQVIGRVSHTRGSRTLFEEVPVRPNVPPEALTEDDMLEFFARSLERWFER